MTDKVASSRVFWALAIAAGWFFVYLIIHEVVAPFVQQKTEIARNKLTLHSPPDDLLPITDLRRALDEVYSNGAKAFKKCVICHSLEEGRRRFGPPLADGFVGTSVARLRDPAIPDYYRYSPDLQQIGEAGGVWSIGRLWSFISDPKGVAPNTRMPFPGLGQKHEEIREIIHFLAWSCEPVTCGKPVAVMLSLPRREDDFQHAVENCYSLAALSSTRLEEDHRIYIVPKDLVDCNKLR